MTSRIEIMDGPSFVKRFPFVKDIFHPIVYQELKKDKDYEVRLLWNGDKLEGLEWGYESDTWSIQAKRAVASRE